MTAPACQRCGGTRLVWLSAAHGREEQLCADCRPWWSAELLAALPSAHVVEAYRWSLSLTGRRS